MKELKNQKVDGVSWKVDNVVAYEPQRNKQEKFYGDQFVIKPDGLW